MSVCTLKPWSIRRKPGVDRNYRKPLNTPTGSYSARLIGKSVVVRNINDAVELNRDGCFGDFAGQPAISKACFPNDDEESVDDGGSGDVSRITRKNNETMDIAGSGLSDNEANRHIQRWQRLVSQPTVFHLGPEETFYLVDELHILDVFSGSRKLSAQEIWTHFFGHYGERFVQRYVTYKYFRKGGWIVRAGIHFGADFMLYCDGPDFNHSTYAVRITSTDCSDANMLAGITRHLSNVRKEFIDVNVEIPRNIDLEQPHCVTRISLSYLICKNSSTIANEDF